MQNLTKEFISQITKEYNEKRNRFSFPTVECSEEGMESLLTEWPELLKYRGETLIYKIAAIIYHITFD